MRRNTASALLLGTALFSIVLITSCKKSSSSSSSGSTTNGSLSATVGSTSWTAKISGGSYIPSEEVLGVDGDEIVSGDTTVIILDFEGVTAPGFTVGSATATVLLNYIDLKTGILYSSGVPLLGPGHALATLNSWDSATNAQSISGTFSGVLYDANGDSLVISNGEFSEKYVVAP